MKILVTGSNGFIGTHLVPRLKLLGTVFEFKSDLKNHEDVKLELIKTQPDVILHLAAKTEVQKSFVEQISFSEINYVGTVNLIESCRLLKKLPFILFASTMEVYGWQPISDEVKNLHTPKVKIAFDENTPPNPNAPYAVAKYACEKYFEYASRAYGLEWASFRQTNAFGRKDNDYFVTEQIITQMLQNKVCNLGYAEPYRNFIFIDDVIDAWIKILEYKDKCKNKIFTIGPDDPRKIKDCASYIAKQLNWHGCINWNTKEPRPGEIYWLNSNHKLLTETTGWQPQISYEDGIDRTIHYWKKII